jgi:copper chaperone CopZ
MECFLGRSLNIALFLIEFNKAKFNLQSSNRLRFSSLKFLVYSLLTFATKYIKMRNLLIICTMLIIQSACGEKKAQYVANKTINCSIEGMTCAEGCAKTIEKTIGDEPGVTLSKVDFGQKVALFSFDSNLVNTDGIFTKIQALNNGQYKVSLVGAELPATEKAAQQEEAVEVKKESGKAHS